MILFFKLCVKAFLNQLTSVYSTDKEIVKHLLRINF